MWRKWFRLVTGQEPPGGPEPPRGKRMPRRRCPDCGNAVPYWPDEDNPLTGRMKDHTPCDQPTVPIPINRVGPQ